ncbi:MAG TPA: DUF937 domain-containing protein [Propionibacteriaceae bacterium]
MSAVDEILTDIPMDQLASLLGVDEATAEQATRQAIPALLGGMQANAEDPAGAASLAGALGDHPSDLIDGGVDLNQVDADDGEKIVGNVFGTNQDQVAQTLGGNLGGQGGGLIKQLLPILAPIVLAYLSKRLMGQGQGGGGGQNNPFGGATGSNNPLNDMLNSMLGGGAAGGGAGQSASGSILDMLGGMLGGGRR